MSRDDHPASQNRLIIRPIEPRDNPSLTQLITDVWAEFDDQTVYFDDPSIPAGTAPAQQNDIGGVHPEHMSLYQRYQPPAGQTIDRSYWVIEDPNSNRLLGGGGFAALIGPDPAVCELQKLYLLPELRGKGMGSRLLEIILFHATKTSYQEMYLESIPEMAGAVHLYEKFGFRHCPRKGTTGHWRCEIFMSRPLKSAVSHPEFLGSEPAFSSITIS